MKGGLMINDICLIRRELQITRSMLLNALREAGDDV